MGQRMLKKVSSILRRFPEVQCIFLRLIVIFVINTALPVFATSEEGKMTSHSKRELSVAEMLAVMKRSKCYQDHKAPLELVFLIDRTSKRVLRTAPRIVQLVDELRVEYPGSRFGISYYADFQCSDWYPHEKCHKLVHEQETHMEPEGCYTRGSNLTTNTKKIKSAAFAIDFLGGNDKASGVAAVLMTAVDKKLGWDNSPERDTHRNKVIFVITDDGTTCCHKEFGIRHPPKGDGTDHCRTMDNPTPELTGQKLRKHDVSLFLALAQGEDGVDTHRSWTKMLDRMRVVYGKTHMIDDDNDDMLQKFHNFLVHVAYNEGPVLCNTDDIPKLVVEDTHGKDEEADHNSHLEIVFLVDRSSKKALSVTPKLMEVVGDIKDDFPKTRFGLSFYADFICTHWYSPEECRKLARKKERHMEPEGCYNFNTSLTHLTNDFQLATQSVKLLGGSGLNAGVAAIMMTAADKKIGWTGSNQLNHFKIIFILTDHGTHCCAMKFGIKKTPKADGMDKCSTMNNPSPEFVGKRLQENGFYLFLTLAKGETNVNTKENWNEMTGRMQVASGMADMDEDDTSKIFKKFKKFIEKQMTRRNTLSRMKALSGKSYKTLADSKESSKTTTTPKATTEKKQSTQKQVRNKDRNSRKYIEDSKKLETGANKVHTTIKPKKNLQKSSTQPPSGDSTKLGMGAKAHVTIKPRKNLQTTTKPPSNDSVKLGTASKARVIIKPKKNLQTSTQPSSDDSEESESSSDEATTKRLTTGKISSFEEPESMDLVAQPSKHQITVTEANPTEEKVVASISTFTPSKDEDSSSEESEEMSQSSTRPSLSVVADALVLQNITEPPVISVSSTTELFNEESDEEHRPTRSGNGFQVTDEPELITEPTPTEHSEEVVASRHIQETPKPKIPHKKPRFTTEAPKPTKITSPATSTIPTSRRSTTTMTTTTTTVTTEEPTSSTTPQTAHGLVARPIVCHLASLLSLPLQVKFSSNGTVVNINTTCPEVSSKTVTNAPVATVIVPSVDY